MDTHLLSHAQDRLAIHSRCCITLDAHNRQTRGLLLLLHKASRINAHLRLDLLAHGSSIQNLCQTTVPAPEVDVAPITSRQKSFVNKVLASQVIASIDSKEILPHV